MDQDELEMLMLSESLLLVSSVCVWTKCKKKKKKTWSRKWLQRRLETTTVLHMLNNELLHEDPGTYKNFLRLSNPLFDCLLTAIESDIRKQNTIMRECIPARARLETTLRFLATGESFRSLMYSTRIHETTISRIVPLVCKAIYENLKTEYLKVPTTEEEWETIAKIFYEKLNFPNCVGAIDGRHISFTAPISAGSYYHNYKGYNSIVFLGLADAEYKFTYVNVGINGRVSDGGVFRECSLSEALENNTLHFPLSKPLPGRQIKVPYVIVADDAFPLKDRIMKPYSQIGLSDDRRIFNYRLSRARRIVENSFGILANRFRVLLNPIHLSVEKVELITLCCIVLHNFILSNDNESLSDMADGTQQTWEPVQLATNNRSSTNARDIREEFKDYFNSTGALDFQYAQVARNNM